MDANEKGKMEKKVLTDSSDDKQRREREEKKKSEKKKLGRKKEGSMLRETFILVANTSQVVLTHSVVVMWTELVM